jgi:radical SAM protein
VPKPPAASAQRRPWSFDDKPALVYLELTQACDLACAHCRAQAVCTRDPRELGTEEYRGLLAELATANRPYPHVVFTGGDPLRRDDLFELIDFAVGLGLSVSVSPAATPRLDRPMLARLRAAGVHSISLSLDGPDAAVHDVLRGVAGTFERTVQAARDARDVGLPVQVNSLVTADTLAGLPRLYAVLEDLGIMRWSLFFLIEVGRGKTLRQITSEQTERLFHWVYDVSRTAPFAIKTTEAMHYRRVAIRRFLRDGLDEAAIRRTPTGRGFGIRDGNGIVFVSHVGEVHPSGFLPIAAGSVLGEGVLDVYRNAPLMRALRDPDCFRGKCGICEYRYVCGGSRARAFAMTGDPFAADPLCAYQPKGGEPVAWEEFAAR